MKNFTRCTVVTRFQNYAKMSFGLKFFLLFTPSCKFLDGALKRTIAAIKNNFLEREKAFFLIHYVRFFSRPRQLRLSPTFIGQLPNWRPTSAAAAALTGVTQRRRAVGQTSGQNGPAGAGGCLADRWTDDTIRDQ